MGRKIFFEPMRKGAASLAAIIAVRASRCMSRGSSDQVPNGIRSSSQQKNLDFTLLSGLRKARLVVDCDAVELLRISLFQ